MTWRTKKDHFTNYTCKWRKTDLGKTNPNHRYFMRLLNNLTSSYLKNNKNYLDLGTDKIKKNLFYLEYH